jgi:hypothetical protein
MISQKKKSKRFANGLLFFFLEGLGGSSASVPKTQVQLVKAALPAGELEFDGQAVQAADPVDALYFPAAHAVHVLDVDPLLQEATKPEYSTVLSDVNTTCMYPVLDV